VSPINLQSTKKGVEISVLVLPRSSKSRIVGIHDNALKIKLTKPPVDGQANEECCRVLAKYFGVSKSQVTVVRGVTSKNKRVLIKGVSETDIHQKTALIIT